MITKFKSVSAQTPKLVGKNLASKIKLVSSAFVFCAALACSKSQHIEKQQAPVVTLQTIQKPTVTGFDAEAFIQEAKEVKAIYQEALVQAKNNAQRGVPSAEQVDALLQENLSKRFGFDFSPLSARTTQEATLSPVYRVLVEEMQAELELLQTQAEMFSEEEAQEKSKAIDEGDYFRVPLDTRTLDYQVYFEKGKSKQPEIESYNSHNTKQLGVPEVVELIKSLPEFSEPVENLR